jgi:hypothetical protein
MNPFKSRHTLLPAIVIDFLMLAAAFGVVHYFKYGNLCVSPVHRDIFLVLIAVWAVVSLWYRKWRALPEATTFFAGMGIINKSSLLIIASLSFFIVAFHFISVSRIQAYGTCLLFFILQVLGYAVYFFIIRKRNGAIASETKETPGRRGKIAVSLLVADGVLLFVAFLTSIWLKRGHVILSDDNLDILVLLAGLWGLSSLLTRKFDKNNFTSYYRAIAPCFKAAILMGFGLAVMIFGLRFFSISRLMVFGTIPLLLAFEIAVFYIYQKYRSSGGYIRDIDNVEQVREALGREQRDLEAAGGTAVRVPVGEKLENALGFIDPALFAFIRESLDLDGIDRDECGLFIDDQRIMAAGAEAENHYRLMVNIQKINDIRWMNQYLLSAHAQLKPGGCLVGMGQTIDQRLDLFRARFPRRTAVVLYVFDFVWNRMIPKLPFTKKIYFALTRGRNRLISRAEILGRLYFCGFRAVAERVIDGRYYFIAQEVKTPSQNPNPTYGPLVLLNRTGADDRPITVYKFRTMHPYSEYLQDYIYEKNLLDEGGKFKDDFRVTEWGRFMRRFWLDELPMFYNWFKGDLQLVGVRPLSRQYLGLYSDELRELRKRVKPGLLPPYYADLPKTLDEIMESEKKYIQAYLASPLRIQLTYFFKSVYNILVRRARSA